RARAETGGAPSVIRPISPFYQCKRGGGQTRARLSSRQEWGLPWVWPCRDGHVAILAITDKHWEALKDLLGRPAWMDDELFKSPMGRFMHADVIRALLESWLVEHD